MTKSDTGWAARTALTRSEIVEVALSRYEKYGFEATTVDQIVADVGIGRRTFFRYFPTYAARQELVIEQLKKRPVDEPPFVSLVAVLRDAFEYPLDPGRAERIRNIVLASPALFRQQRSFVVARFDEQAVEVLLKRPGNDLTAYQLGVVVQSVVDCVEAATMAHLRGTDVASVTLFNDAVQGCRVAWASLPDAFPGS
jgi:AcrR family transcriptional regulator